MKIDSEPSYDDDMALPAGKTCADCKHVRRCVGFGFSAPERNSCDFHPNRFALPSLEKMN